MGDIPSGEPITQRDLIEFMMEVRLGMAAFTKTLEDFQRSLEEHTDRIDADADGFRSDFSEKIKSLEKDVQLLKDWRISQAAWIAGALAIAGVIIFVINKIWK